MAGRMVLDMKGIIVLDMEGMQFIWKTDIYSYRGKHYEKKIDS
jgi:hypothetical protein